jgi:hypothetical protein
MCKVPVASFPAPVDKSGSFQIGYQFSVFLGISDDTIVIL